MTTHQAIEIVLAMIDPATASNLQRQALDYLTKRQQEEEERLAIRKSGRHHAQDFFQ